LEEERLDWVSGVLRNLSNLETFNMDLSKLSKPNRNIFFNFLSWCPKLKSIGNIVV
jgi:hypothetical protein